MLIALSFQFYQLLPPPSLKYPPVKYFLTSWLQPPLPMLFPCLLSLPQFSLHPLLMDISSYISKYKLCRCVFGDLYLPHILSLLFRTDLVNKIKGAYQLASKSYTCAPNPNFIYKRNNSPYQCCELSSISIENLNDAFHISTGTFTANVHITDKP